MYDVRRLEQVVDLYKSIAGMHKPDLISTEDFLNWNALYFQVYKLKNQFSQESDQEKLAKAVSRILAGTFAELKEEIPKMVAEADLDKTMGFYLQMKEEFTAVIKELEESSQHKFAMS